MRPAKMDAFQVVRNPISTEKAVRIMEAENKLVFIVDKKATKTEIRQALEEIFKIKAVKINTLINHGVKKAYVTLSKETKAIDIATQMGLI